MKKMPWVRFFASDWLAGTRGMSAVETGVYITLIATMYERGEPIQEDHARLARLCGASNSAFKKALETLVDEGKITRGNDGLWNDRVEKEHVYLSEKSEVGSKAAKSRWNKKDNENNSGDDADALPAQCDGNANQKPDTRTIEESSSLRSEERARAPKPDFQSEFENDLWPIYPRKAGKGQALKAYCAARKHTPADVIITGATRYAAERIGQDASFTKHPATWINGQCWLDEPTPPRSQSPPSSSPRLTHHQQRHQDALAAADKFLGIDRDEPEFAGSTFDLEPGDFRSH